MRALVLLLVVSAGCGYRFEVRPPLVGGVSRVRVPVFENTTPEVGAGALLAARLAERAQLENRLGEGGGVVHGRVTAVDSTPAAFPSTVAGAGLYTLSVSLEVRLLPTEGGKSVRRVRLRAEETYLAGPGPEATEANRRRALDRVATRLADDAWRRITE